jgi:hypothetical protein
LALSAAICVVVRAANCDRLNAVTWVLAMPLIWLAVSTAS